MARERPGTDCLEENYSCQIAINDHDFKILKSSESRLCEVLQKKFGCVSTLSGPALEGNSSSLAQQVFRAMLTPKLELSVWKDDLTRHAVDAVVNAANEELCHGGGLAWALVQAGGPEIQEESNGIIAACGRVPTGQITVTKAGKLPCKQIIHAVGPQWMLMNQEKSIELLRCAILNVLKYVTNPNAYIRTVAIPALSSGIFRFPVDLCTQTILETICSYFHGTETFCSLKEIHLVSNEDPTVASFKVAAENVLRRNELSPWRSQETTLPSNRTLLTDQHLTLQIVQDHIELQATDIIVNSISPSDFRNGHVSSAILQQAGVDMERELIAQRTNLSSNFQPVLITKGFNLFCHSVFHVVWCCSGSLTHLTLKNAMKICLENCLKPDICSISFPALGTGHMGMKKDNVAQIMFDEVLTFAKNKLKKPLTVKFVIFPKDMKIFEVFCAEMAKRSKVNRHGSSVPQQTREEQRGNGLESPAINLMGSNLEEMHEAKAWIHRLLNSQDHYIIMNNHIFYLGKKEHDFLSETQRNSSVSISETICAGKAMLEIKGNPAHLIKGIMDIEYMLCDIQEEVMRKEEKRLLSLSGQWTDPIPKHLDKLKENIPFQRCLPDSTQELQDRKTQFEKCGFRVLQVEQINNLVLQGVFQKKKEMMESRTQKGAGSQRLFQQVPHQFCNVVCRVGFHRLYSVNYSEIYGAGIQFTKNLKAIADNVKTTPNTDALVYVFEAEVLTGSFCQGQKSNIIAPPLSPGAINSHDSVVDNVSSPETIVVFSGMQAMPKYLWICTWDDGWSRDHILLRDYSSGPTMFSSQQPWKKFPKGSSVDC